MNRIRSHRVPGETGQMILICVVLLLSLVINPLQHQHPTRLVNDDHCPAAVMDSVMAGSHLVIPVVLPVITGPQEYLVVLIESGFSSPGEYSPVVNRAPPHF